ncbi:hypothetical protein [Neisseria meningitidis]|uniref:hypothetical protein n=1 Tax=Neisseria meningitidis TaxID=487 RepID=UPI000F545641|nr:hypothetical protein [Neisseria meningitidis]RQL35158.1 hypothetical protein COH26_03140 [Neisseria meningitidis]
MKKIRLLLEFHCFPVWFYDENDEIIENDWCEELLPQEILSDNHLKELCIWLADEFDKLYCDEMGNFDCEKLQDEFSFQTKENEQEFIDKLTEFRTKFTQKCFGFCALQDNLPKIENGKIVSWQ